MPVRPFLIDAHAHVSFNAYQDDADEVIARAEERSIWMLAVGSQIDTSRRAVDYASRYPHIWAVVGLHPIHLVDTHVDLAEVGEEDTEGVAFRTRKETFEHQAYRELTEHPKTVGIGECGLDYYRIPEELSEDEVIAHQQNVFRQQIAIAQETKLPLMVHVRDGAERNANNDVIRILAEAYGPWYGEQPRGMMHCYSGTSPQAAQYLALGFNLSFTGVITFRPTGKQRAHAEELWRVVREVPLDRFHVETDCPYLTPEPHRGERNEPRHVLHVAECVAALKGISIEDVAVASVANTLHLFRKMEDALH